MGEIKINQRRKEVDSEKKTNKVKSEKRTRANGETGEREQKGPSREARTSGRWLLIWISRVSLLRCPPKQGIDLWQAGKPTPDVVIPRLGRKKPTWKGWAGVLVRLIGRHTLRAPGSGGQGRTIGWRDPDPMECCRMHKKHFPPRWA